MNTFTRISAAVGMILITGGLVACGNVSVTPPAAPDSASLPIPPTEPAAVPGWAAILGDTSAPEGWQAVPCENPILLCVSADSELMGTVERASYPLSDIDLAADVEPIPGSELEFLRAWVAEHYAAIEGDRQTADSSLVFSTEPPTEISVGGLPGLRYSFGATRPNGALFDRYVGYVATDGELLHIFVTGIIPGDTAGVFSDSAALEQFEPHLDDIIRGLSLASEERI
ncbi:MAG: hypothetical protein VKK04_15510 [Synechococcales bacterium]|nr:hypothetical protein [Synechococcales bacterium]